jgi:light-regulated signal transduction histidine kinase (bacteriophytochrome)
VEAPLIVQLFQNLVGNSLKYAGSAPPRIHITSLTHADHHEVIVRDWGIGVPRDAAERVFQIFQRLHTRDEYPGTGVGLALCRRIVACHGGQIWLSQPEDGAGCAVHFTLPMTSAAHAQY